ncbi:MAG: PKD domain-containing protein [Chloroflexi bacterium]|nr:PKD domain-containing protein [Chloroflexota bacterium]
MERFKWLSKKLVSGALVMVMLAATASIELGTGLMAAASNPPDTEWEQTYGGSDSEYAYSVQQTSDGGYIVAGETGSYGAGIRDFYLVKTDASGNLEWQQTYGGSDVDSARSVQQTADGGYIMAGITLSYGAGYADCYLVKTDASGNMEWQQTFGGSNNDYARAVQQTSDGGYIVAGETGSYGAGKSDFYLVKTDASGNLEWQRTYGGSADDYGYSAQQTSDGGYVMAGITISYADVNGDFYVVKTDASGNVEWEKTYGENNDNLGYSIQQTSDGGYIVAGQTANYSANWFGVYLVKTDAVGDMEWDSTFAGDDYDDAYSVQQTADGGYIVAGVTWSNSAGEGDCYLVKTDASGNMEWEKTIGDVGYEYAWAVKQTVDGGYIVAGETSSYGAGAEDVYLVKVGPWINTPVGANVTVSLESGTVTFPDVLESGTTTMTTSTENPVDPTPSDFYVIEGKFIEITTTASYGGLITVGISYDETQVSNEASLRLFHWNGSAWEDVTTSVDTVGNIVYGQVTSLSPFFIGEPAVAPVADAGGPYLTQVGYSVGLDGSASYHPSGTIESYDWSFGDNATGSGVIVSHTYTDVGIYGVNLTVTDSLGVQSSDTTMAVVYDPEAGSATGGGWFWSAKGNLKRDLESEGKATFGFVVKYKQGAAAGNLEFQYHVGDINLKSADIAWLVVSSSNVNFQGEGTINGEGLYTFRVLAKDGDKAGGQPDEFTIRIWQGTDTEADPIYQAIHAELGGGNIIIHNN